jgi:hypothetical protein
MGKIKLNLVENKMGIIPFIIVLIIWLKYYLFNYMQIVPIYGPQHRLVSWLIILPLFLISLCFSVFNLVSFYKNRNRKNLFAVLFSIPFILDFIYFFLIK